MASRSAQHEPAGVRTWQIVIVTAGLLMLIAVTLMLVKGMFWLSGTQLSGRSGLAAGDFPEPRLQTEPGPDLARLQAQWDKRLSGYDWIDRERDIARIPVGRAMRIIAARGSDAYKPIAGSGSGETPPNVTGKEELR